MYRITPPVLRRWATVEPECSGQSADAPDRRCDQNYGEHEEPSRFDQLERPEPAGRLVGGPQPVPVLHEVLHRAGVLRDPAFPGQLWWCSLEDLAELGHADPVAAPGGPLLADDPRRARRHPHTGVAGDKRPQVVLAQVE